MPKVTFVDHKGGETMVEAEAGDSLMEAAVRGGVDGILADCGGACACATCHVYVDAGWLDRIAPPGEGEAAMLEFAIDPQPNSRLSCQIPVSDALDGLVVMLPKSQF